MSKWPAYRAIPQWVVDNLYRKREAHYTTRLNAWIRVVGNSGEGLVLQSNPDLPLFGSTNSVYGTADSPGVVGLNWAGEPVTVQGEDRGIRPSPTIGGLTLSDNEWGLARECNFTIDAYTRGQVDVLQKYFGEPGHTVLVEFGWDLHRAHNELIDLNTNSIANLGMDFDSLLKKRKDSQGDYNAILGFITGFKVGSDGDIYKLDVTIKGMGNMPGMIQTTKPIISSDKGEGSNDEGEESTKKQPTPGLKYMDLGSHNQSKLTAGEKNWRYFFNALPNHKQTAAIKALAGELNKEENYINFNDSTRNKLGYESEGGWLFTNNVKVDGSKLAIPNGTDLIGQERFVKFSVIKKVLDTNDKIMLEKGFQVGPNNYPIKIFTEWTVCSGFQSMFSTKKDVLLVPNENCPDFGFLEILSEGKQQSKKSPPNPCAQRDESGNVAVQFPEPTALASRELEHGFKTLSRNANTWGYLDNLYVNMDFIISILEKESTTYRDVLMEILNGMSAACGNLWKFEIVESAAPESILDLNEGQRCLQVVDMACTSHTEPEEIPPTPFVHNGEQSFFLGGTLDIDLPGDMASSIIADRKAADGGAANISGDADERETNNALFNQPTFRDSVLDLHNAKAAKNVDEKKKVEATPTDTEEKDKADLYNSFLEKIGAYPSVKDGRIDLDKTDLDSVIMFPTYDDEMLWKKNQTKDNPNYKADGKTIKGVGPLMGTVKYNFDIHGNSGIAFGDTFTITGLPEKYTRAGEFTTTSIEHSIDGMNWKTTIEGQFRPKA